MNVYSDRAELYARYRWDYAEEAYRAIFSLTGLDASSVVVDLGAGTGICARHFAGRAWQALAVEPDAVMCAAAARHLSGQPGCSALVGSAEAVPLADHFAHLITVAQAIHWFQPEAARREIARVLRPGGWLAVLHNRPVDAELGLAITAISTPENGVDHHRAVPPGIDAPLSLYYGHEAFQRLVFPFCQTQDWDAFWGSMLSASYMPNPRHPGYPRLERAARSVFERFSAGGWLESRGETILTIGKVL